tara:strand:+ start:7 stop:651 length:645 start_codon:yes stop_codon:yes gene_type:complete
MKDIAKLYPFQVFRHRIYVPILNFIDHIKDKSRKISTQKYIELEDLGISKKAGVRYESISYSKLKLLLLFSLKEGFSNFLDIGCGLGRPIIVAGEIGYSNLYGVDISSILTDACKMNIEKMGLKAELECSDIDNYDLPPGKLCIFLFNPFGKEKIENLIDKIKNRNQDTLILYHNPKHSNLFPNNFKFNEFNWSNFGLYEEKCFCYLIPAKLID